MLPFVLFSLILILERTDGAVHGSGESVSLIFVHLKDNWCIRDCGHLVERAQTLGSRWQELAAVSGVHFEYGVVDSHRIVIILRDKRSADDLVEFLVDRPETLAAVSGNKYKFGRHHKATEEEQSRIGISGPPSGHISHDLL